MSRSICVPCKREFRCKKNEITYIQGKALWSADLYECPGCKTELIQGRAINPVITDPGTLKGNNEFRKICDLIKPIMGGKDIGYD